MLRKIFFSLTSFLVLFPVAGMAEPLKVVATLSAFADLAKQVGGSEVEVSSVAPARFNLHFIEPRPSDVLKLKRADLFIHAGLDLEAWRDALVNAAARPEIRTGGGRELNVSQGIHLLNVPPAPLSRSQGDIHLFGNPHYWLDPRNGIVIAQTITAKLKELRPEQSALFDHNVERLERELSMHMEKWRQLAAAYRGRELVGYHDEWVYLMDFLGMRMEQFIEEKPGIPPGPQHIDWLVNYIRDHRVGAVVQATFYPTEASQAVADRSGARLVVVAQNVGEVPEASDYMHMVDFDVRNIVEALNHG